MTFRDRLRGWWRAGPFLTPGAAVTLIIVIIGAGIGIYANQSRINQINATAVVNSARSCEVQQADRQSLRDVIDASFTPRATTTPTIPPTPGVPQPTVDLLNTLLAGQLTAPTMSQLRTLLLSKAPAITCVRQSDGRTVPIVQKGT